MEAEYGVGLLLLFVGLAVIFGGAYWATSVGIKYPQSLAGLVISVGLILFAVACTVIMHEAEVTGRYIGYLWIGVGVIISLLLGVPALFH
jgi:hypothetical protein